jgi:hypothetical protein
MKKLCILLGILLMSILLAAPVGSGQTFSEDEVLALYAAAGKKLGEPGVLHEEHDTTPHRNFKMHWHTHYLSYTMKSCHLAVVYAQTASSTYTGYVAYVFKDYNFDGKVDSAYRSYYVIMRDGTIVNFSTEMPDPTLKEAYHKWMKIPQEEAQKRYEIELEFWRKELLGKP